VRTADVTRWEQTVPHKSYVLYYIADSRRCQINVQKQASKQVAFIERVTITYS